MFVARMHLQMPTHCWFLILLSSLFSNVGQAWPLVLEAWSLGQGDLPWQVIEQEGALFFWHL